MGYYYFLAFVAISDSHAACCELIIFERTMTQANNRRTYNKLIKFGKALLRLKIREVRA